MKEIWEKLQNYNKQTEKTGTYSKDEITAKSCCDALCDTCFCCTMCADGSCC